MDPIENVCEKCAKITNLWYVVVKLVALKLCLASNLQVSTDCSSAFRFGPTFVKEGAYKYWCQPSVTDKCSIAEPPVLAKIRAIPQRGGCGMRNVMLKLNGDLPYVRVNNPVAISQNGTIYPRHYQPSHTVFGESLSQKKKKLEEPQLSKFQR